MGSVKSASSKVLKCLLIRLEEAVEISLPESFLIKLEGFLALATITNDVVRLSY